MSDDYDAARNEMKSEGRSVVAIAAIMLALGAVFGAGGSVTILHPFAPDIPVVQAAIIGIGTGLLGGITLVIVYCLVEGRLIDMYLDTDGDETRGETA